MTQLTEEEYWEERRAEQAHEEYLEQQSEVRHQLYEMLRTSYNHAAQNATNQDTKT